MALSSWSASTPDYTFAFNVSNFSDRVLRIEMVDESMIHDDNMMDADGSICNTASPAALRFKDIHISSLILAEKSPFFLKLFSNGMKESAESHVTIQIKASEEKAFMDLLHFMYSNTLHSSTEGALLGVLRIADKFEVVSCMRYCCHMLCNLEMSLESALLYLDLHSNSLMPDAAHPLVEAAKQFIESRYTNYDKCQDDVLKLPLAGFEVVIGNDDFCAPNEEAVFDLMVKYVNIHYPSMEERRNILQTRLSHLIRYPFLSSRGLRKVLSHVDYFDPEFVSSVVMEALFLMAEKQQMQHFLATDISKHLFNERPRNWMRVPIRVIEFKLSQPQIAVYLELKREVCAKLFPQSIVFSQPILFNRKCFWLLAKCNTVHQPGPHWLGFYLMMHPKFSQSETCSIDYKFSVRTKPREDFEDRWETTFSFEEGKYWNGSANLLNITWTEFIADDSIYFINDILHLKAELKASPTPQQQ